MSRFRSVIAGVAAVAATLTMAAPAQAATTVTTTDLFAMTYLGDVSDLAVTNTHVFATHNNRGGIAVTDAAGVLETTIGGLAGPSGLTLSPDRGTLYVALSQGAEIAAYDTATLERTATYPLGGGLCPQTLAVTGRWLWFGEACEPWMGTGRLGRLDLTTGAVSIDVLPMLAGIEGPPVLAVAVHNVLLVGQRGYDSGEVANDLSSYALGSDGTPHRIGRLAGSASDRRWYELSVSPDGRALYLATEDALLAVNPVLLGRPIRRYPALATTFNLGVNPVDSGVAVIGDPDSNMIYTVSVLGRSGVATWLMDLETPQTDGRLSWSPDGRRFYVLGEQGNKRVLYTFTLG